MHTLAFDDVYPHELLVQREATLRRFWVGEGARAVLSIHNGAYPYRQIDDDDLIVERAAMQILTSADLSDDYLPWFGPDFGTISTSVPWGGEIAHPDDGCMFIKPVIFSPDEVDRVQPANPDSGHVARAVKLTRRLRERLGTSRFWTRTFDVQGPLNTAALLWEQTDFLCSMISDPDAVHALLDRVTDHLIAMVRAMRVEMSPMGGNIWPYVWLPDDLGICFTEDMMPLLSPELYREFGIPYMKRLADAFGGAFIHCCGAFEQHLESLSTSGVNFLGFDYFEPLTRTEALYDAFGSRPVYHVFMGLEGEEIWGDTAGFLEQKLARVAPPDMRFWFTLDNAWPDAVPRAEAIRRLFL